jgi:DNA polymerase-1
MVRIVESTAELPQLTRAKKLFMDFETTAGKADEKALNPYKGDKIAGVAVTADDHPYAYYVPMRHRFADGTAMRGNLDVPQVQRWMKDVVESCDMWSNANVKFDAHFAHCEGATFRGRLRCLTTSAKLLDSDRTFKGGYGLKPLSEAWLDEVITDLEDGVRGHLDTIKLPRNKKANDYGLVPIDIMARYAGQDALTARKLDHYIERMMPEDCLEVWETEQLLTPVLFDMEVEGMRVDQHQLEEAEMKILLELTKIEETLHALLGFAVNPASSPDCFMLLCTHWGLPVLEYNEDGNPSFDKDALAHYLMHPDVKSSELRTNVVMLLQHYRKRNTLLTFFVRPYQEHNVGGIMHPDYNQAVRSGRMSCKRPNAQQLNKEAKSFILPGPGEAFLSCDYSQIEFRLIVHYTRALEAIKSYERDPDTDFHQWVADMCGIPRKPAKNVNFAVGYGAGKAKVTTMLAGNMDLMKGLGDGMTPQQFNAACRIRAEQVFEKYHEVLPGLRPTTKSAAANALHRGYVFTAYGRRCHLPDKAAHVAFNRVVQGTAADIMKERTVAVSPRYNDWVKSQGIKLAASVHDETKFKGEASLMKSPEVVSRLVLSLEDTKRKFRVPIRAGAGWSDKDWASACDDKHTVAEHGYGKLDIVRA